MRPKEDSYRKWRQVDDFTHVVGIEMIWKTRDMTTHKQQYTTKRPSFSKLIRIGMLLFAIAVIIMHLNSDAGIRNLEEEEKEEMSKDSSLNSAPPVEGGEDDNEGRREEQGETEQLFNVDLPPEPLSAAPDQKPIMHTFYEPVKGGCCGMSPRNHDALLDAWRQSWEERGWETRILREDDARKHPGFDIIQRRLEDLHVGAYDQRCFWRWLAMASLEGRDSKGGGWMSDYDVFPLSLDGEEGIRIAQMNNGTFQSFARHVPCLIHASRTEWDRVLHLMVDTLPQKRHKFISDMYQLLEVQKDFGSAENANMIWSNEVAETFIYNKNEGSDVHGHAYLSVDCKRGSWTKAVHLSHFGIQLAWKSGIHPDLDEIHGPGSAIQKRGKSALVQMKDFHEQCLLK